MIRQNIHDISKEIGAAKLIVVSKYRSISELEEVYKCGVRSLAENRVQELIKKRETLPLDIKWHLIGHLQSNKVKQIASFIHLIHSVDSIKLLKIIDQEAHKNNRVIDVLLQIQVSQDESKFGFDPNHLIELANSGAFNGFEHIQIRGLMTMSTLNATNDLVEKEFISTRKIFDQAKPLMPNPVKFSELSMGMSSDYLTAIRCGSTMVRIGSSIFD